MAAKGLAQCCKANLERAAKKFGSVINYIQYMQEKIDQVTTIGKEHENAAQILHSSIMRVLARGLHAPSPNQCQLHIPKMLAKLLSSYGESSVNYHLEQQGKCVLNQLNHVSCTASGTLYPESTDKVHVNTGEGLNELSDQYKDVFLTK